MKLKISPDLSLPLDAVTQTFGILAKRGAGKSNAAVVMAEEMYSAGLHWVAIDPKGDWHGIRSSADGRSPGLPVVIFGGAKADVPLEPTGGPLLADLIVDEGLTCVLDVSEFSESEKIRFLAGQGREEGFAGRLFRRKNGEQPPTHLFLEEAHDYIPQRPFRDQAKLVHIFGKLVTMGRTKGLGATLISQRSARIHKDVLTQVDTLIVLRTTGPQDRKAIADWLEFHGQQKEILESLPSLEDGEAWIWSPEWLGKTTRVRLRRRETYDSGATPEPGKVNRRPATAADVDLKAIEAKMRATIERAKQEDPKELRAEIARLRRDLTVAHRMARLSEPQKVEVEKVVEKRVEVPILRDAQVRRLEQVTARFEKAADVLGEVATWARGEASEIVQALRNGQKRAVAVASNPSVVKPPRATAVTPRRPHRVPTVQTPLGDFTPSGSQQRILDALVWLESLGLSPADKTQVALLADQRPTSGGYFNNLGRLRSESLIEYPTPGQVALTDAGRACAQNVAGAPITTDDLHRKLEAKLSRSQWAILRVLIDTYPENISKDELAERAGQRPTSGGYFNNLGRLRSLKLIDYPEPGRVAAQPVLFLEGT